MVLDKNVTKYIQMNGHEIIVGQDARSKEWYCKELPCKDCDDADKQISSMNQVLNKYNKPVKRNEKKTSLKKETGWE